MKDVLLSIKPKWCELIASGKKTIEVRKTKPKLETPFKCFIYCTKPREHFSLGGGVYACSDSLFRTSDGVIRCGDGFEEYANETEIQGMNGKVIGEFVCDEIIFLPKEIIRIGILMDSCLAPKDYIEYKNCKDLYAWHISDLVIYDTPKEIWEFWKPCPYNGDCTICGNFSSVQFGDGTGFSFCKDEQNRRLSRPPQSWCYVV